MAYYSLVNYSDATHAANMLAFRGFMTTPSASSGPGWVCVGSGDGKASGGQYSGTDGSAIDNATSGASKSLNNQNAWFVLKSSDNARHFLFQRKTDVADWKITYSRAEFDFGAAGPATAPALKTNATNGVSEGSVIFDGTLFRHAEGDYWMNVVAGDGSLTPSSFYMFAYKKGGLPSGATTMLICDILDAASTADGDQDSCVVYANSNATPNHATDGVLFNGRLHKSKDSAGTNTFKGFVCYNKAAPAQSFLNVTVSTHGTIGSSGTSGSPTYDLNFAPHNISTSAFDTSADETLPVYYFVVSSPTQGQYDSFKGGSSLMLFGNKTKTTGQLLKLSSDGDRIFINGFLFPWTGQTPAI